MEKIVFNVDVHMNDEVKKLEAVLECKESGKLSLRAKFAPKLNEEGDERCHVFQMIRDWVEGLGFREKED